MAGRESQGPDSRPGEDVGGLSGLTTWRVATLNKLSRSRARWIWSISTHPSTIKPDTTCYLAARQDRTLKRRNLLSRTRGTEAAQQSGRLMSSGVTQITAIPRRSRKHFWNGSSRQAQTKATSCSTRFAGAGLQFTLRKSLSAIGLASTSPILRSHSLRNASMTLFPVSSTKYMARPKM